MKKNPRKILPVEEIKAGISHVETKNVLDSNMKINMSAYLKEKEILQLILSVSFAIINSNQKAQIIRDIAKSAFQINHGEEELKDMVSAKNNGIFSWISKMVNVLFALKFLKLLTTAIKKELSVDSYAMGVI